MLRSWGVLFRLHAFGIFSIQVNNHIMRRIGSIENGGGRDVRSRGGDGARGGETSACVVYNHEVAVRRGRGTYGLVGNPRVRIVAVARP